MISDLKSMYSTSGPYPSGILHDTSFKEFTKSAAAENGIVSIYPVIIPLFRVLERVNHDGKVASVQLQVKYARYHQTSGHMMDQTDWMRVPRIQDTNGL